MKIQFCGAAGGVTGSQHLLTINGKQILLDCGLFQGKRQESLERNQHFDYDPRELDALILSHAHIDHTGNIPNLVKQGFRGVIYCTEATQSLCSVMLMDSAHIQESDALYFSRHCSDSAIKPIQPLYTMVDAEYSLSFFKGYPYHKTFKVTEGVNVTFYDAGHVLGSSFVVLDILDHDHSPAKAKRLLFTGDMGRQNLPILRNPEQIEAADILITEGTYGNRRHDPIEESVPALSRAINRTIRRGGKVMIPAFSLERTQEIIYGIHQLTDRNEIPRIPIFIDSPLSNKITDIFGKHKECYNESMRKEFKGSHNPFKFQNLKMVSSVEDSKQLNFYPGPCVIIAASGMCEAGRIRHHLKNNIENPNNSILVVGYMAEETLGRKLVEGMPVVKIFDQFYKVNSEIIVLNAFSAHADQDGLDDYISRVKGLRDIFIVHSEAKQADPFAERLRGLTQANVYVPQWQDEFII